MSDFTVIEQQTFKQKCVCFIGYNFFSVLIFFLRTLAGNHKCMLIISSIHLSKNVVLCMNGRYFRFKFICAKRKFLN